MQIYSFDENTHELLINTLREADYIDACTPAIPFTSIVVDQPLPALEPQKAFVVIGKRNNEGYLTVSQNISMVADYRHTIVYDIHTGAEKSITELGQLPADVTTKPRPDCYYEWNGTDWIEQADAAAKRLADKRAAMPNLTRVALLTTLYQTKKIKESDIRDLIDAIEDEDQRYLLQIEFSTNAFERTNPALILIAEHLGLKETELDQLWEKAVDHNLS